MGISERVNKIVDIDKKTANKLIKMYRVNYNVKEIFRFDNGKSTSNYKLTVDGLNEYLVLKIYPENNTTCEKEVALYKKVKDYLPVAEILYSNTEKKIVNNSFVIMKYIEGITLDRYINFKNSIPKSLAEEIGEKLALLHMNEYDKAGMINKNLNITDGLPPIMTWYDYFLNNIAGERIGSTMRKKIRKYINENEQMLFEMTKKSVLAHGDFRPENLMIKDDKLAGILDWEFSLAAPYYFDIGQFIRIDEHMINNAESNFIKGYNRNAKYQLNNNFLKLARLMDLANLLSLLNVKVQRPNFNSNIKQLIDKSMTFLTKS